MAPVKTDEQRDDLAARRRRKEARQGAPRPVAGPSAADTSRAARGLLGGLITGDAAPMGGTATADPGLPQPREPTPSKVDVSTAPPDRVSENVDDLVRRVSAGAAASAADAALVARRRPKGTADLAAELVPRHQHSARKRRFASTQSVRLRRVRGLSRHRWALATAVLLIGVAGVAVAMNGPQTPSLHPAADGSSRAASTATGAAVIGQRLSSTINDLSIGLRALIRHAAADASRQHRVLKVRSRRRMHHPKATARRAQASPTPAPIVSPAPAQSATSYQPPSTPSPVQEPAGQAAATSQPSSTNSSRSAGPSGSDPLGGIGSCVKGC